MMPPSIIAQILYDPVLPIPILLLLALGLGSLTIFTYVKCQKSTGFVRSYVLCLFRLIALALTFFILLNPHKEVFKKIEKQEQRVIVALDTSASMAHRDNEQPSRIAEARIALDRADLVKERNPAYPGLQFYRFDESARMIPAVSLSQISADGNDTRFHQSIRSMLNTNSGKSDLAGIFLLTDGHDFELVNPARTAQEARRQKCPIFILPFGSDTPVRDAAIHIASYKPYIFSGQSSRIDIALRMIGCEYEDFELKLYREGTLIETRKVAVGDELQRLESFSVMEEAPGQFAYEVKLSAINDEVTLDNNQATTFLNVSDKKINLLLIEGSPYWDTNFTQRSLWSNEKFDIDSITSVAKGKHIALRKEQSLGELIIPKTAEDFDAYDCVLLGKHIDRVLSNSQLDALANYVQNFGGNVIFTRGNPTEESKAVAAISPIHWGETINEFSDLEVNRSGRSLSPFELLNLHAGQRSLRQILGVQSGTVPDITTVLVGTQSPRSNEPLVTMAHRRAGSGQVLAIASAGLWRSAFHADLPDSASLFDQFWDNLILWLISGRDSSTKGEYAVLLNTANLSLGQTVHIRMKAANPENLPAGTPADIFEFGNNSTPIQQVILIPDEGSSYLTASYTPKKTGIFQIKVTLPDGTEQTPRFSVYQDNREVTEVSVDLPYLERLAELSGGRTIKSDELKPLIEDLLLREDPEPIKHREAIWDKARFALVIASFFALDWFLRRRWGLC